MRSQKISKILRNDVVEEKLIEIFRTILTFVEFTKLSVSLIRNLIIVAFSYYFILYARFRIQLIEKLSNISIRDRFRNVSFKLLVKIVSNHD